MFQQLEPSLRFPKLVLLKGLTQALPPLWNRELLYFYYASGIDSLLIFHMCYCQFSNYFCNQYYHPFMHILNGIPVLIIQAVSELGCKPRSSQLYYVGPFQYPVGFLWLLLYPWLCQTALFRILCYSSNRMSGAKHLEGFIHPSQSRVFLYLEFSRVSDLGKAFKCQNKVNDCSRSNLPISRFLELFHWFYSILTFYSVSSSFLFHTLC